MSNSVVIPLCLLLVGLVMVSGCQTTPRPASDTAVPDASVVPLADGTAQPQQAPEPPPPPPTELLFEEAQETARSGDYDAAIAQFRELLQMQPEYPGAHTRLGLLLLNEDQLDEARDMFSRAIEIDDGDAVALNHLAVIERRQGQFQQALEHYLGALAIDPEYAKAHLNIGILYDIYLGNLAEALKHYRRYQDLTGNENEEVTKWIADLERRMSRQQ